VFPLHQITHVGVNVSRALSYSAEKYFRSIPTYVITVLKLYRQRRTDRRHAISKPCSAKHRAAKSHRGRRNERKFRIR